MLLVASTSNGEVPVRVRSWRQELRPGYLEMDMVSHGGRWAVGEWIYTLSATDLETGWSRACADPTCCGPSTTAFSQSCTVSVGFRSGSVPGGSNDLPRTPLRRLLDSETAKPGEIEGLIKLYTTVSPLVSARSQRASRASADTARFGDDRVGF